MGFALVEGGHRRRGMRPPYTVQVHCMERVEKYKATGAAPISTPTQPAICTRIRVPSRSASLRIALNPIAIPSTATATGTPNKKGAAPHKIEANAHLTTQASPLRDRTEADL